MPKATISTDTIRCDLKTAPPDGFVVLKRMGYQATLTRRDISQRLVQDADGRGAIVSSNERTAVFEFQTCVVDHNLEDENGAKLNLTDPETFASLDPRIAGEIEDLIEKHCIEGGDAVGNSVAQSSEQNSGVTLVTE